MGSPFAKTPALSRTAASTYPRTYPDRLGGNPAPKKASRQTLPPRRQVEPGAEVESGMPLLVPILRDLGCQRTALRASFGRPPC
jgi:hypothetical protein